jgi:hypothetical protein
MAQCKEALTTVILKGMIDLMKRALYLNGIGKELILSKATAVKTPKRMIYLDELDDGTWRLIYNENLIPDMRLLNSIDVIRED